MDPSTVVLVSLLHGCYMTAAPAREMRNTCPTGDAYGNYGGCYCYSCQTTDVAWLLVGTAKVLDDAPPGTLVREILYKVAGSRSKALAGRVRPCE